MADGYRFPQQNAGAFYYPQPRHQRQPLTRISTPPNNIRSAFIPETPSPSRSPNSNSPAPNLYGMYNQQHQGQHGRVNGGPGRGGLPMMNFFQNHNTHHQPAQHHQNIQQDQHTAHATNGLSHHPSYSSGTLASATPSFIPANIQNGHGRTNGGQAQQINEHWAEQLTRHKEADRIHHVMIDNSQPNHYARTRAGDNKGIQLATPADSKGENVGLEKDPARMAETAMTKQRQDWVNLDLSGQGLRVLGNPLSNYEFLRELYVASNKITSIPSFFGQLRYLQHLDASHNLLTELPPELGMCVMLKELVLFNNKLQTLPNELGALHKLVFLGIEGNQHFDPELRQTIVDKGTVALITQLRETGPIPLPPAPRPWIDLQDGVPPSANQEKVKVMSYNILSNGSCTTAMYGHSPSEVLSWDYRKEKILQEITSSDADIVCLQELEKEAFHEFFSMQLAYSGYKGIFWSRSRAKTMGDKEQLRVDGCGIFYKSSNFILVDKQGIEYNSLAINRADMKNQKDIFNRIMNRDHIGLLAFFENRQTGSRFMVANTHIFWDPAFADVKLIQVGLMLSEINKFSDKYARWAPLTSRERGKTYLISSEGASDTVNKPTEPQADLTQSKEYTKAQLPLIICSDLNSTIESGVYELLSKGSIPPDHVELEGFTYGDFTKHGMEHPFQLRSAYTNLDKTSHAVPWTNYTPGFRDVIDHIWYSTNALENLSLLGAVDPEYMRKVPGFPNHHFPSDHLSLVAEFAFKGKKEAKTVQQPDFGPSKSHNRR